MLYPQDGLLILKDLKFGQSCGMEDVGLSWGLHVELRGLAARSVWSPSSHYLFSECGSPSSHNVFIFCVAHQVHTICLFSGCVQFMFVVCALIFMWDHAT